MKTRTETDSMGAIEVDASRYWGAQTARSLANFKIGNDRMPIEVIHALAIVKKAAAKVNSDLGLIENELSDLIIRAADEVIGGDLDDHFPLSVWQTGSGTQTNMNVNEVISNRANVMAGTSLGAKSPVHPNDHVNMSQSSNDAFPTAMHIAAVTILKQKLLPSLVKLELALASKGWEFDTVVKIGRTHLMDATPITVSQEFSGWVSLLNRDSGRIESSLPGLLDLAIGGTAVGTGLNTHPQFAVRMAVTITEMTQLEFRTHPNKFAALSSHDELVYAMSCLSTLAGTLLKIANDIRWLGSGPRCGLGELHLPENEPGSSIMPGKVNPTQCEALTMVAAQVFGANATVSFAGSQGNLQLNVYKPVIIYNFLNSATLLAEAMDSFRINLVEGLKLNYREIEKHVANSLMLVTAISPTIGYDRAAKVAHTALEQNITLRDAAVKLEYLSSEQFDELVQPAKMTMPLDTSPRVQRGKIAQTETP